MNIDKILKNCGLSDIEALPRDASVRHYFRARMLDKSVIVMFYPQAIADNCKELSDFVNIGSMLDNAGVKIGKCYELNENEGYGIFEDLGRNSFGKCLRDNLVDCKTLYDLGTRSLIKMRDIKGVEALPLYKDTRIYANRRQLIDYYMAFKNRKKQDESVVSEFLSVWEDIEQSLPLCPAGFVHGDYHLENLMYTEDSEGSRKCALIDYQDAFYGPLPYDLLNLLEDARVDVPEGLRLAMVSLYLQSFGDEERDSFQKWFRVLAAQFHGRVIGLFIKLAAEQNRDAYLAHIPRLQSYINSSLQDPVLEPLKSWFAKVGLDFEPINDLDGNHIRSFFEI